MKLPLTGKIIDHMHMANGALLRSANQMRVILALGQSGISNFALVLKKIKKKCPLSTNQHSVILPSTVCYKKGKNDRICTCWTHCSIMSSDTL